MKMADRLARSFPYAFARVSAMKARLIAKDEYHKLLRMDLAGITRYLQDSDYKEPITELSATYQGIELVDQALKADLTKVYSKLRRICPEEVVAVVDLYLERADMQNLKIVLRALFSNVKEEEFTYLLEPWGKYDEGHYRALFNLGAIDEALKRSGILSEKDAREAYETYKSSTRMIELENYLDMAYYNKAIQGALSLKMHGRAFSDFLLEEIDVLNIKNLLRFKSEGLEPAQIVRHIIPGGLRLRETQLKKLAGAESEDSLRSSLARTYYGKVLDFKGKITDIELELKKYHLRSGYLKSHQNPLSIEGILSYMLSKELEISNLRTIVKAKHLDIDPGFVEKSLMVMAK